MPYPTESVKYFKRIEDFIKDKNVKTREAKELLIDILARIKDLEAFKVKAVDCIEQYSDMLSLANILLDQEKTENLDDRTKSISVVTISLLNSLNNLLVWLYILTVELKDYPFEDATFNKLLDDMNDMFKRMLTTSVDGMKNFKSFVPSVRSLRKWKSEGKLEPIKRSMNKPKRRDNGNKNTLQNNNAECDKNSSESTFEDRDAIQNDIVQCGEDGSKSTFNDRNTLHNDSAQCGEEPVKSTSDDQNALKNNGTKCRETPGISIVELSASAYKNDINEGGKSEYVRNQVAYERPEIKLKKTFKVISDEEMAEQVTAKLKDICQNISTKSSESPYSSTLDQPKRMCKSNINREECETPQNASGISTSKGPYRYKRKCTLYTDGSYINKDDMDGNKSGMSKNFVPMPKRRSLGKNDYSDTHKTNVNGIGKEKINTLRNFMSTRSCRANKCNSLSAHENDLSENNSRRIRKKSKANLSETSETKTEDVILRVKSKKQGASNQKNQNRRGRKKKNVMHQQEINENFKSSDKDKNVLSLKVVSHYACSSLNTVKSAHVVLKNVLDDPKVQHYLDVIKCNERKKKESIARCKEKNEMDETAICKDRNEMEALQAWNVVDDAVSDEEDKEYDNIEDIGRLSNNDSLESDSDVDQEHIVSDAVREQLENDDSDRELDDSNYRKELDDENYDAEHNDNSSNSFDSKTKECKKGPSTPDAPPPESDLDHSEDENDADSVKSEDGVGSTKSFTSDDHQSNGSKESQLSPQSDESEVIAVTDDEESNSSE